MANPIAPMRAFVKTREGLEAPDALLGWVPFYTNRITNSQKRQE